MAAEAVVTKRSVGRRLAGLFSQISSARHIIYTNFFRLDIFF
jgi:hypothetical protein